MNINLFAIYRVLLILSVFIVLNVKITFNDPEIIKMKMSKIQ